MTLAKEGVKYNIHANTIAPLAASRMTEAILPEDILKNLKPEFVTPLVEYLTHESTEENGSLFEVGAGYVAKLRWERSAGHVFKTDQTFTPALVQQKWDQIVDFSQGAEYPQSVLEVNWMGILEKAKSLPPVHQAPPSLSFEGRVVIVTGAGTAICIFC